MRMVTDQKYYHWLQVNARKTAAKYDVSSDDLLQDFLLSVLEGKTAKFEHVFFESIRKEFQRGVTGKRNAAQFILDESVWGGLSDNRKGMTDHELIEYLCDLRSITTESEYKLVLLYLMGFESYEIFEQSREITRRELTALWQRVGIRGVIA